MHSWQVGEIIWEDCFLGGGYRRRLEEAEGILAREGRTSTSGADQIIGA